MPWQLLPSNKEGRAQRKADGLLHRELVGCWREPDSPSGWGLGWRDSLVQRCLTSVADAWGPSPSQQIEGIKKEFGGVLYRKTAFIWVVLPCCVPWKKGLREA